MDTAAATNTASAGIVIVTCVPVQRKLRARALDRQPI